MLLLKPSAIPYLTDTTPPKRASPAAAPTVSVNPEILSGNYVTLLALSLWNIVVLAMCQMRQQKQMGRSHTPTVATEMVNVRSFVGNRSFRKFIRHAMGFHCFHAIEKTTVTDDVITAAPFPAVAARPDTKPEGVGEWDGQQWRMCHV